jgi:tetratricopeptide (TPR) repeat protein
MLKERFDLLLVKIYQRNVTKNPDRISAWRAFASVLLRLNNYSIAHNTFQKLVEDTAGGNVAHVAWAEACLENKSPNHSIIALEKIEGEQYKALKFFLLGRAYADLEQWDDAIRALKTSTAIVGNNFKVFELLGFVLEKNGNKEDASKAYNIAWEMDYRNPQKPKGLINLL